jgi:hypothetical protein
MVKIIVAHIFFILVIKGFGQDNKVIQISDSYSVSLDHPAMFGKGQILRLECDSIYLLNCFTFDYFKSLRALLNTSGIDCTEIIDLYKNALKENELLTTKLLVNADETGQLNHDQFLMTKMSLESARKSLDASLEKIEKARLSAVRANKQVTRFRTKNTFGKIMFGIGGIGIGILTGIALK